MDEKVQFVYQDIITDIAPAVAIRDKSGVEKMEPHDLLKKSTPCYFTFDESSGDSVLSLAGSGSDRKKFTNDRSGIIDCRYIVGSSTGAFTVWINDGKRYLSNRPLHSTLLLGNGQRPFSLPLPLYIGYSGNILCDFVDLSTASNTIRMALVGMKYAITWDEMMKIISEVAKISTPFIYTTDSDMILAGSAEATGYMTIDTQGDFYAKKIVFASTGAFKARVYDEKGREFGNGWIHSDLIGGNGEYSWNFEPQLFSRGGQVKVRIQDVSGSTNQIWFAFAGYNMYYQR